MKSRLALLLFCSAALLAPFAQAADASVSLLAPKDGAVVTSPFDVRFGVSGMEIKPAGDMTPNTGHHHLLITAAAFRPAKPFRWMPPICITARGRPKPASRCRRASTS